MPTLNQLRGLNASDRSKSEQDTINQVMGYKENNPNESELLQIHSEENDRQNDTYEGPIPIGGRIVQESFKMRDTLNQMYEDTLKKNYIKYRADKEDLVSAQANEALDKVANEVSSYYKKYKGTDKIQIDDNRKKQLMAEYDTRKEIYGEDNANIWLDKQFKEEVANNQTWWQQALSALASVEPTVEGGAIEAFGNVYGAIDYIFTGREEDQQDLGWWDALMDSAIDNPITRYGRDVTRAKASHLLQGFENAIGMSDETVADRIQKMYNTGTKYNPDGIGDFGIVTTEEQDNQLVSWATPWQALESGGFTALSMLVGAGEAKIAAKLFGKAAKGAVALKKAGKMFQEEKSLRKALTVMKKAENFTQGVIVPGAVGTMEGAVNGLETKINTERDGIEELNTDFKKKIDEEVERILNDDKENPLVDLGDGRFSRLLDPNEVYAKVADKYKDEYLESLRQVEWAASKAGIHDFYTNSLINGMVNQTLKAGIMAPRVQEVLRNNRATGWAFRKPKFNVKGNEVTPAYSKAGTVARILREPLGEGFEEYTQDISSNTYSAAAQSNIKSFINNKLNEDGSAKVTDSFGSDYAAAWTALKGSLTDQESIKSAILGAVSSAMGTIGPVERGYHVNEEGKLERNSLLDPRNLTRGLNSKGEQETRMEYARRVTPWRSGLISAIREVNEENREAQETAAVLTEWLKDPQNKAKWDGLKGTANWAESMHDAAEGNDEFSYRNSRLGKAINDVFMLKKLEGTDFYDSIVESLKASASGNVSKEDIEGLRQSQYNNATDEEIIDRVKLNAQKMLDLMESVEKEDANIQSLIGRADEDTKQALIFDKIMEQSLTDRKGKLEKEVSDIVRNINDTAGRSGASLTSEQTKAVMKYGSLNKAITTLKEKKEDKERLEKEIKEIEDTKRSERTLDQKLSLMSKKTKLKEANAILKELETLYKKDEKGKVTDEIDENLKDVVMSEREILDLDPITRALVLAQGAEKFYNATHQNLQRVDALKDEIHSIENEIEEEKKKVDGWTTSDGKVKKGHNKQVAKANEKIETLNKKLESKNKDLDIEQGRRNTKEIYSKEQQDIIDSLVRQGTAVDSKFLDKVVDLGRIESSLEKSYEEYENVLSDPDAFHNYVQGAKKKAHDNVLKMRAERVANAKDFKEFSDELNKLSSNVTREDARIIAEVLKAEDEKQRKALDDAGHNDQKTNFEQYKENESKKASVREQFISNPTLTNNDVSLINDAMEYLQGKGIDIEDRNAVVSALTERDEQGELGGDFRKYVENKNSSRFPQQRTMMPYFTSIGQIVNQYVDLLNSKLEKEKNRANMNPVVTPVSQAEANSNEPKPAADPYSNPTPESTSDDTSQLPKPQVDSEQGKLGVQDAMRVAHNTIDSSDYEPTIKDLVRSYIDNLIQDENNKFETFEDVIEAVLIKSEEVKQQLKDEKAAGQDTTVTQKIIVLLDKVAGILKVHSKRGFGGKNRGTAAGEHSLTIESMNIDGARALNPNSWSVKFYDKHDIEGWNRRNYPIDWKNEPVYFITDTEWSAEVMKQMYHTEEEHRNNPNLARYSDLTHMPVVMAVKVEEPSDVNTTTAIQVDGAWYQPIGIFPSTEATVQGKKLTGAEDTKAIRNLASSEQGRHLITVDGNPGSMPLTSRVNGLNYLNGESNSKNRDNSKENNTDAIIGILNLTPVEDRERLEKLSRDELLEDPVYKKARTEFVQSLTYEDKESHPIRSNVKRLRSNETRPIYIFRKNMLDTYSRIELDGKRRTLEEVLKAIQEHGGTGEELVRFNTRLELAYKKVIEPLFIHTGGIFSKDKSARAFTKKDVEESKKKFRELLDDEAERLTDALREISYKYIFINPKSGWELKVFAPKEGQNLGEDITDSSAVYNIALYNSQTQEAIKLAEIKSGAGSNLEENRNQSYSVLKNLLWDSEKNDARDLIKPSASGTTPTIIWQTPRQEIDKISKENTSERNEGIGFCEKMTDDDILEFAGNPEDLRYNQHYISVKNPLGTNGEPSYKNNTVANNQNASPSAPQNTTLQAAGSVLNSQGEQILPDSGTVVDGKSSSSNPVVDDDKVRGKNLKEAEEKVAKIKFESEKFTLSEDDTYYYVENKETGITTKYARVTSIINADESLQEYTQEQLDEAASKREYKTDYLYKPTLEEVYNHLKSTTSGLKTLTDAEIKKFRTLKDLANALGITNIKARRAEAELRTEYKKNAFAKWKTPSTAVGNSVDSIVRDFFSDSLKDLYPNVSKESLDYLVKQLRVFKNNLDAKGIKIESNKIVAYGDITVTDADGSTHNVKVAGTLDLLGYDDKGNFYIFDMKTTHNHSKVEQTKWSRQISMYADLLNQKYGITIRPENLRIIPINVEYPAPKGKNNSGVEYTEVKEGENKGQLMIKDIGDSQPREFHEANPSMRSTDTEQYQPGYTSLSINWDRLSSTDQDIASEISTQVNSNSNIGEVEPKKAEVQQPEGIRHEFEDSLSSMTGYKEKTPTAPVPEVEPNRKLPRFPKWVVLSEMQKEMLAAKGIDSKEAYEEAQRDPAQEADLRHDLGCN